MNEVSVQNVSSVPRIEIRARNVAIENLAQKMPAILAAVREDPYTVVAARDAPDAEPEVLLVGPELLRVLGEGYDAYQAMLQRPEFGELQAEVAQLRRAVRVLLGQLEAILGEDGEVPASCLSAIFGQEVPAQTVGEGKEGWKEIRNSLLESIGSTAEGGMI